MNSVANAPITTTPTMEAATRTLPRRLARTPSTASPAPRLRNIARLRVRNAGASDNGSDASSAQRSSPRRRSIAYATMHGRVMAYALP